MIEEVKDFFGDVKDKVGSKGLVIIVLALVGLFLYNLLKDGGGSDEVYYNPSGVTSYPSVDKNADVVIDSVNQTIEAYHSELLNVIANTNTNISGNINESTSTLLGALTDSESNIVGNITESAGTLNDTINDNAENIIGSIGESTDRVTETVEGAKDELTHNMGLGFDSVHLGFETVENYINESMSKVEDLSSKIDNIDTTPRVEYVTKTEYVPKTEYIYIATPEPDEQNNSVIVGKPNVKEPVTITKADVSPEQKQETYTYTPKAGLNTSTSIVDALKATGENSSLSNRKKIAEANGIENYTGSYSQNLSLLNKLKAGTLVKPA